MSNNDFYVTKDMLAPKGKRFLNHLLDLVPQYAVIYGIAYLFFYIGEFTGNYVLNDFWNNLSYFGDLAVTYFLMICYYFLMESLTYKTLGKYITNTIVVLPNGEKPSYKTILTRTFCRLIPFDGLSFLGTDGKGWHDSLSKTYVVDERKFNEKLKMHKELEFIGITNEESS